MRDFSNDKETNEEIDIQLAAGDLLDNLVLDGPEPWRSIGMRRAAATAITIEKSWVISHR